MSKRIQGVVAGVLATVLLFVGVAAAASIAETINVTYRNIKIVIDGEELIPKDVNGNIVEPFIYEGTTYLPVRAVSQALDKEVGWNASTNTVNINSDASGESDIEQDSITKMIKSIENRDVIDEALLASIDNAELVVMLKRYNELTSYLFGVFFVRAAQTIVNVTIYGFDFSGGVDFSGEWHQRPPSYPFPPEAIAEATWRIAKHTLYADARQRIENDPYFVPVLDKEGGGSAGMWPQFVHNFYSEQPELSEAFAEYKDLVEKVIVKLREIE